MAMDGMRTAAYTYAWRPSLHTLAASFTNAGDAAARSPPLVPCCHPSLSGILNRYMRLRQEMNSDVDGEGVSGLGSKCYTVF